MDGIGRTPGIRPRPTLGRRLDLLARGGVPVFSTLLIMLATCLPWGLRGQALLLPAASLCAVWFWSLMRPATMPPSSVFMIGLLHDLLGYAPLGTGSLVLLAAHGLAVRSRRTLARQKVWVVWLGFAPVAAALNALAWVLASALSVRLLPLRPAVFEVLLCVAFYPVLAVIFLRSQRHAALVPAP